MFKNYFKIAVRNLLKNKSHSLINIVGLSVGIAVCFLIFLWVQDELSYDRFHEKSERTYRVLWDARFGDNEWTIPLGPVPVADALEREFPEVQATVRIRPTSRTLRRGNDYQAEDDFLNVEESFFDVFTLSFVAGNPETALQEPNSVVLTQATARRYFPETSALGQTLELSDGAFLQVTGVVRGFPSQSHFHFDFLAPLKTLSIFENRKNHWGSGTVYTYLVLHDGATAPQLEAKIDDYVQEHVFSEQAGSGNYTRFLLQPLTDIHLHSHLKYELAANGNVVYVYLFTAIGLFILILACINFINLATARSANRAREVGVRKVFGSHRTQLTWQFLFESFVFVVLAVLLAVVLAEMVLPAFNQIAAKQLSTDYFGSPAAVGILAAIAVGVAFMAGTYPAFFLASFLPVRVLRSRQNMSRSGVMLRNGLVVLQFCISIALIVGTLVVRDQLHYVQDKKLGFDKEQVLVVKGAKALGYRYPVFREQLAADPRVVSVSAAQSLPGYQFDSTVFEPQQPANYEQSSLTYAMVDEYYAEVLGLDFVAGRNFSKEFATDSSAFLINQAAAEVLGWEEAIGKNLNMGGGARGPVVGVIEDFHFESLHHEVKPVVFPFIRWQPSYMAVRLQHGDVAEGIAAVRDIWEGFVPHQPFAYSFLDQDYQQLYDNEQRVAKVFGTFAILAIFIACLGLFGLASFVAEQRTKEIGIRKVLGASVSSIAALLSKDFTRLVLIALVAATPLAYFAMHKWLRNFAYHVELGWTVFVLAGGLALAVAVVTVSTQAIRAALANPVESLRYE